MRFVDIRVGQVVRLTKKNGGLPEIVLAIGKYGTVLPAEPHSVKWKGYTYLPSRWYTLDTRLAQRMVVTMALAHDTPPTLRVVTSAGIAAVLPEGEAVRWVNTVRSSVTGNQIRKSAGARKREYEEIVREIYYTITGTPVGRRTQFLYTAPIRIIADDTALVERLVLLWMNYVKAQGNQIVPGEDAEQTIDAYLDAMAGMAETSEDGIKAAISKEQAYEDLTAESPEWLEPMRIDGKVVGLGS